MTFNWRYFIAAVLIAGVLLLTIGVPLIAITLGIAGAGLFMWRRSSHSA